MEHFIKFLQTDVGTIAQALGTMIAMIWTIIQQFKKADK